MRVPIIMPQLGESIAEATVLNITVGTGDEVGADQEIIEVETNKALLQVTTPCAGKVLELLATPQQTYAVGEVLGYVEASPAEIERLGLKPPAATNGYSALEQQPPPKDEPEERDHLPATNGEGHPAHGHAFAGESLTTRGHEGAGLPVPAKLGGAGYFSPRLRARLGELGLQNADLAGVAGTGAGGRVTVADLEKYVDAVEGAKAENAPAMRLAVADSMRRSVQRPIATVGRPVQMDLLRAHRQQQPEPRPAYVLYTMRALALALAEDRAPAGRLIGKRLLPAASLDIGCAVEVDGGLMVPVLRGVDTRTVAELNGPFQELVATARRRQLSAESMGSAVATVTNFGTFGLTWGTPIPLPEESLMLGLGAAAKVPSWDEDKGTFVPVTEAELTLTFDHRVLDGGGAGRLLQKVAQLLQDPDKL